MLSFLKTIGSGYLTYISGAALILHGITGWWLQTTADPATSIMEGLALLGLRRSLGNVKQDTKTVVARTEPVAVMHGPIIETDLGNSSNPVGFRPGRG